MTAVRELGRRLDWRTASECQPFVGSSAAVKGWQPRLFKRPIQILAIHRYEWFAPLRGAPKCFPTKITVFPRLLRPQETVCRFLHRLCYNSTTNSTSRNQQKQTRTCRSTNLCSTVRNHQTERQHIPRRKDSSGASRREFSERHRRARKVTND